MKNLIAVLASYGALAFFGWLVWSGLARGEVRIAYSLVAVRRDTSPVRYWLAMLFYGGIFLLFGFLVVFATIQMLMGH